MNILQAIALGLVQGITEFLPVSSSGHLVIGQKIFGLAKPPVLFDILVHIGTLLAVLVFFKNKFLKLSKKIICLILIGTVPAALAGLFLNQYAQTLFNSLKLVGVSLLATAFLLFSTKLLKAKTKIFSQLNWQKAFIVGCFQALAILPGVSRSGSTIIGGLWTGLKKETAFDFSFLLAVPAILGALALQIPEISSNGDQLAMGFVGLITASISGFLSLKLFKQIVLKSKLYYFGFYCLVLGVGILLASF